MKKPNNRAEQRLRYRWPVRFTTSPGQKQPFSGQLVDVSSKGMAMLYHADENCPRPEQLVTADFGVPYFDTFGSFDTVLFSRAGRVCRVDNLNSRVNRVVLQFAEPLFFKPGEQNITEADAQQRLEAKVRSVIQTSQGSATCGVPPTRAEPKAVTEAKPKTKAGKKTQAGAEKGIKAEAETRRRLQVCSEQIAKVKADAAKEIARITTEAEQAIAKIESIVKPETKTSDRSQVRNRRGKSSERIPIQSKEGGLMEKVETFFSDRSTVF